MADEHSLNGLKDHCQASSILHRLRQLLTLMGYQGLHKATALLLSGKPNDQLVFDILDARNFFRKLRGPGLASFCIYSTFDSNHSVLHCDIQCTAFDIGVGG